MMGGKRPPKEAPKEPPLEDHELYTAEEMLPYFAQMTSGGQQPLSYESAKVLLSEYTRLPGWVKQLVPLSDIQRILNLSGGGEQDG